VHSVSGAPKEAFVKVAKAEDGGLGATGLWRPATLGLRPEAPSEALTAYLAGQFVRKGS
jgi:nitrate reductase alpha subunit